MQVAVGPGFVVEMANLAVRVWSTGAGPAQLLQTSELAALYGSGTHRLTDPRIVYDTGSGRWLATISDLQSNKILVAVSTDGDPTRAWTVSAYAAPGCADQPRLGVADDVVVVSADIFSGCEERGSKILGSEIWVVNKQQLLAGSTTPAFTTSGPTTQYASLAPVQSLSPTATQYIVAVDDRASRVVRLLTEDGIPPEPVHIREVAAPSINPLLQPPPAAQPLTSGSNRPPISTNDNRILDSVWEDGRLWFSANGRCVPPGDSLVRACARIVELSTVTRSVTFDTDLGFQGVHTFYPALRPDADGDLVVVAGQSGVNVLPQLIVVARTPAGAWTAPIVVAQSAGIYFGDRYGDYFGAARDPSDPRVVWVAGEAGTDTRGGRGWSTDVASIVVTPAGGTIPSIADTAAPGLRAVAPVGRKADSVRLAYLALDEGVSVRTIVTVDRRKTLVFRATTPRATLHAAQQYVVLWTGTKRLHGTFRFCVSALSPSGMQSPRSCTAVTLR